MSRWPSANSWAPLAGLKALTGTLQPRRERLVLRTRIIRQSPELRERELVKLASWAAALEAILRERGLGPAEAAYAAETATTTFRVAFERWTAEPPWPTRCSNSSTRASPPWGGSCAGEGVRSPDGAAPSLRRRGRRTRAGGRTRARGPHAGPDVVRRHADAGAVDGRGRRTRSQVPFAGTGTGRGRGGRTPAQTSYAGTRTPVP
ncbi:hypothetical protein [Streptomyces sp. NPDC003480]